MSSPASSAIDAEYRDRRDQAIRHLAEIFDLDEVRILTRGQILTVHGQLVVRVRRRCGLAWEYRRVVLDPASQRALRPLLDQTGTDQLLFRSRLGGPISRRHIQRIAAD